MRANTISAVRDLQDLRHVPWAPWNPWPIARLTKPRAAGTARLWQKWSSKRTNCHSDANSELQVVETILRSAGYDVV